MGDVVKGIHDWKQSNDIGGGGRAPIDGSDPGVQATPLMGTAFAPDLSGGVGGGAPSLMSGPFAPVDNGAPQQQASPMVSSLLSLQDQSQSQQAPEPVNNPYSPTDTPQEIADANKPVDIQGDAWKPKRAGWLGGLIDDILRMKGREPVFNIQKNLPSAMEGAQNDPERAVRRLRQISPRLADQFEKQYNDNQASQALVTERNAATTEHNLDTMTKSGQLISNTLGAIDKGPNAAASYAQLLPTLRRYAKAGNFPQDMLPDTYDPVVVNGLRQGGILSYQQETLKQNAIKEQNNVAYRGTRLGQMADAIREQNRHNQAGEATAAGNLKVSQQRADQEASNRPMVLKTTDGRDLAVNKDGMSAKFKGRDGKIHTYIKVGQEGSKIMWRRFEDDTQDQNN
jgi:hypothetical protein